jgi:hypothetical protein
MGDIGDVVCAFCGSRMGLSRETPASAETHALRFFACDTCGASELRIDRSDTISHSTERDPIDGR